MNSSSKPGRKTKAKPTVPRDREVDDAATRSDSPGPAAEHNMPDEGYSDQDKPLVAGSAEARQLHKRPPRTKGTLGVGTAGDAARPTKTGVHSKTVPARGRL